MKHVVVATLLVLSMIGCQKKEELETAVIKSNSMVCGSCAKTVEKAVDNVTGVKNVEVNLEAKTVEVKFIPAQTTIQQIENAITDAGYNANNRKRNPEAYEKLDACCKLDK